jgi:isoquinoline 1-oxidoreductase beta subunit
VATVVEVTVSEDGELSIPGVWMAVDAGTVVNRDSVRNQMEGASVFGLSLALHSQITVKDGAVEQGNFDDYLVARMNEAPARIEVDVVDSDAPPAGVGEPGTPPFAPALCNAIHAATGKRIRELPIGDQLRA